MNYSMNDHVSGIVETRMHLDKQFEIESNQDLLKGLKVDVIMMNTPSAKRNALLSTARVNSVFLHYLAYVMVGLALSGLM